MTINAALEQVDRQKPNAVDDRLKAGWVLELEGRNFEEMLNKDEPEGEYPRQWPEDGDMELKIPAPYEEVYVLYVIGMIEFTVQEYANYNNTMTLFNNLMGAYKAWYRRGHLPERSEVTGVW